METIACWVRDSGRGLMITGGQNAYAPGGYFRSPLEPVLPVSMELKREHRKLSLAILVALDRSGSMQVEAGGGKTKMDLAELAAVEVLELLAPMDEFGVIAVDTESHVVIPLDSAEKARLSRSKILRIMSQGGGIYIFEALATASRMLLSSNAEVRHIILFADAADSEEPGEYAKLLEKCREANITVSAVGLGKDDDKDAWLLKDIAHRGRGRCLFTENPRELPRLFAQDTFIVSRSAFIEELTEIGPTSELISLTRTDFSPPPPIGGYNLCYARPGVHPAVITRDKHSAPVVAAWHAGLGRVLCYTGEADGGYAGPIREWPEIGKFYTSLALWTAGTMPELPENMAITQEVLRGVCLVQLHLDPERDKMPFTRTPAVNVLRGVAEKTMVEKVEMQWITPDTLGLEIPLHGKEIVFPTVDCDGLAMSLAPLCLPYSPEFEPGDTESIQSIRDLARATGGKERPDPRGIFKEMPLRRKRQEIGPYLLLAALLLILLEILERRTGLLTALRLPARSKDTPRKPGWLTRLRARMGRRKAVLPEPPTKTAEARSQEPGRKAGPEEEGKGVLTALHRAAHIAKERTLRGEFPK